jgi:hypothetical protein
MAKIKVFIDPVANTMNLWWKDRKTAFSSEETDDQNSNDVVIKDRAGKPIGVEIIGLFPSELNLARWWPKVFGAKHDRPFLLQAN